MLIGELSAETGISKDTLRFYEKIGLISAGERRAGTRTYKEFSEGTINRLGLIQKAKKLGFTLNEIRQTLDSWTDGSLSVVEKIALLEEKMTEIDGQIEELKGIKGYLDNKKAFLLKTEQSA